MPAGRPLELTPQVLEDVRLILPTVLYLETVGDYLGLDRSTWGKWLRRGAKENKRLRKSDETPLPAEAVYLEFFLTVKKALAEGEIYSAGIIKKAAEKNWQAAAWVLERRFEERWGRDQGAIRELLREIRRAYGDKGEPAG